jgi:hypothetical protein
LIVFAVVIVLIFLKWAYLRETVGEDRIVYADPMNEKVVDVPFLENCCSWWPISHLILFFFLGYFFPECWLYLIAFGVLWEIFEAVMFHLTKRPTQVTVGPGRNVEYTGNWWAGSFKDVLMNTLGVLGGLLLRRLVEAALGESRGACGEVSPGGVEHGLALAL